MSLKVSLSVLAAFVSVQSAYSAAGKASPAALSKHVERLSEKTGKDAKEIREAMVEALRKTGKFTSKELERIGLGGRISASKQAEILSLLRNNKDFKGALGLTSVANAKVSEVAAISFERLNTYAEQINVLIKENKVGLKLLPRMADPNKMTEAFEVSLAVYSKPGFESRNFNDAVEMCLSLRLEIVKTEQPSTLVVAIKTNEQLIDLATVLSSRAIARANMVRVIGPATLLKKISDKEIEVENVRVKVDYDVPNYVKADTRMFAEAHSAGSAAIKSYIESKTVNTEKTGQDVNQVKTFLLQAIQKVSVKSGPIIEVVGGIATFTVKIDSRYGIYEYAVEVPGMGNPTPKVRLTKAEESGLE